MQVRVYHQMSIEKKKRGFQGCIPLGIVKRDWTVDSCTRDPDRRDPIISRGTTVLCILASVLLLL